MTEERARHESLDALLDAAVDAIIISDRSGSILRMNPAAQKSFGYSESELLEKNVDVLMPEPDQGLHDSYLENYRKGGAPAIIGIGREVTALHSSGREFPIHLSVGEISGQGRPRFVAIIRDLSTEKATRLAVKELETHLAHADRLVVLGELTAGIAHEINQPLTAIAAFADAGASLLKVNSPEALAELENICQRVSEQARRAGEVVNRLRRLSRKDELSKSTHHVSSLIKNVLLVLNHEIKLSGIQLIERIDPDLPDLLMDEIQIQQVLVNLVKNSIDAIREANIQKPEISIIARTDGEYLSIHVQDNGRGVPVDFENDLFKPFYTTKKHGVGLGLSICKNIATQHGGKLRYEKTGQSGARFTLSLPLAYIG